MAISGSEVVKGFTRLLLVILFVALSFAGARAEVECHPGAEMALGSASVEAFDPQTSDVSLAIVHFNFPEATAVRLGNTRGELLRSEWLPYAADLIWYIRGESAATLKQVYLEIRHGDGRVTPMVLPVRYCADPMMAGRFPPLAVPDPRTSDVIWSTEFDEWNGRWATYQDAYGRGNVFFPMSHSAIGGSDGNGFIWTDDSRWIIDPPEQPNSVLISLLYWRWLFSPEYAGRHEFASVVDLSDTILEVDLRGHELGMRQSKLTFWILCGGARWHLASQSLVAGASNWHRNRVELPADPAAWSLSWARGGEQVSFCIDKVESFGFALRGFGRDETPSGRLDIDRFVLRRAGAEPSPG